MTSFKALRVTRNGDNYNMAVEEQQTDDLPAGEILVRVHYSSLNYKDALSASGNPGVTRNFPHTPGIDAAGVVEASDDKRFKSGDEVIVTGYDLGMNTPGGYGGYIRVPASWVVKLPAGLSLQQSMIYGTAGFTAALSVAKLQHAGLRPDQGEVVVTGASGGVGSIGVALLAKLGYEVIAGTGKAEAQEFLCGTLGAKSCLSRDDLADDAPKRPLSKPRWAGVLDTVGGDILATALKSTRYGGRVSCAGAASSDSPLSELQSDSLPPPSLPSDSVFPFILRGVDLLGVDSVELPMAPRLELWQHLATDWNIAPLQDLMTEIDLNALNDVWIDKILAGQVLGRVVVKL